MEKDIVIQNLPNGRMIIEFAPSQINEAVNVDGGLITIKTDGIDGVTCVGYKQAHCIDKKDVDSIDISKHPFDAELSIEEKEIDSEIKDNYQSFFDFMHNEHDLILTQSQMEDIIREAKKY